METRVPYAEQYQITMGYLESVSKIQVRRWLGRHGLFWLVVMAGYAYLFSAVRPSATDWLESLKDTAIRLPYLMAIIYVALYWVLPSALAGRNAQFVRRSVMYLLGSWLFMGLYRGYVVIPIQTGKLSLLLSYPHVIALLDWYIALAVVGMATGIRLYRFWFQRNRVNQQLAHETMLIELQVLKAQIHPHFLFNTLNNLYSLTLQNACQTSEMVLKLADMLHYMIYECNRPDVSLAKELLFLENYIELEKLRYGARLTVSISVTGDMGTNRIAPLMLIPVVENAFKHGSAQQIGPAHIELALVMTGHELQFSIKNSIDEKVASNNGQNTAGIGLTNVRKRLTLLYPDAHTLRIRPATEWFVVELTIQLNRKAESIQPSKSAASPPH